MNKKRSSKHPKRHAYYGPRNEFSRQNIDSRTQRDHILIVCEDSKHTINYLNTLCTALRINTPAIEIRGRECGSAPISVFEYTRNEITNNEKDGLDNKYDRIYSVFDKDSHTSYEDTKSKINGSHATTEIPWDAIISIPCFEYWLLLHFVSTTKPMSSNDLKKELKKTHPKLQQRKQRLLTYLYPLP